MTHFLKHLTDEDLLNATVKLVKEEREILSRLLHHLREIERRRLYSQVQCASLYDYLTKELESTSKRKAEMIIAAQSLAPAQPIEKFKPVACGIEVKFTVSEKLLEKIEKLKGLLAHKNSHLHLCKLLDLLCDLGLEKYDKVSPAPAREKNGSLASLRREVWKRAGGACQICGSGYALENRSRAPESSGRGHS